MMISTSNSALGLNYPSEDYLSNECMLVWNFWGKKPFKKGYSGLFSLGPIEELLSNYNTLVISDEKFFDTSQGENHVKRVVSLGDSLAIGYQYLKKDEEDAIVPIFTIYYLDRAEEDIEGLCKKILESKATSDELDDDLERRTCYLSISPATGLSLEDITIPQVDWKVFWKFYSARVEEGFKNLLEVLDKKKQTITLISGGSGSGKTSLARVLSEKTDRDIIYIAPSLVDLSVSSPDFLSFCNTLGSSVIILDGIDTIFESPHKNPGILLSILQNLTSGFFKDILDIHFVLVLENKSSIRNIEKYLSLDFILELEDLEPKRATSLSKYLGKSEKFSSPTPLSTIIHTRVSQKSMGF